MNNIILTFNQVWQDLDSPSLDHCKRAVNIALPLLHLHAPTAAAISLSLGAYQIYCLAIGIDTSSKWQKNGQIVAQCAVTVLHLGVAYVSPVGGALLSSGTLLGKQVYRMGVHLSKKEWNQFNKELLGTMVTIVHLFAIFSRSPMLISLSITFRSISELKESYSLYQAGKWPEALVSLALAIIRLSSARPYISEAWSQYFCKSLTQQDADRIFKRLSQLQESIAEKNPAQNHPKRGCSPSLQEMSAQQKLADFTCDPNLYHAPAGFTNLVPTRQREIDPMEQDPTENGIISVKQVLSEAGFYHVIEGVSFNQFSGYRLSQLDFSDILFKKCSLSKATIEDSAFEDCRFIDCQFDSIFFRRCEFNSIRIENTHFSSCRFNQVLSIRSKIQSSFFTNCLFEDTAFFDNALEETSFDQSSFQSVCFNDSRMQKVSWQSSKLSDSTFLGVQTESSTIKNCDIIDTVFCEAESTLNFGNSNFRENIKPVISITWNFLYEGHYGQIICKKLRENGVVPLKFQEIPLEIDAILAEREVEKALASLEHVQLLNARCIGEKLLLARAPGSELDKIYKQAALISKYTHAHLVPGGEDIEPELYGEELSLALAQKLIRREISFIPFNFSLELYSELKWPKKYVKSLLEISILHHADRANHQIMGICRGSQMINVFYNGTLRQHVNDQKGIQTLRSTHLTSSKAEELKDEFFGVDEIYAFSMHHQCAKEIGAGLHVLYESETGVPKMLVHENGRVIATQFHPEMYDDEEILEEDPNFRSSAPLFQGLFQRLRDAGKSTMLP